MYLLTPFMYYLKVSVLHKSNFIICKFAINTMREAQNQKYNIEFHTFISIYINKSQTPGSFEGILLPGFWSKPKVLSI